LKRAPSRRRLRFDPTSHAAARYGVGSEHRETTGVSPRALVSVYSSHWRRAGRARQALRLDTLRLRQSVSR